MKLGLTFVVLGYVLSQFYRAFLAVLAPMLESDIGVGPDVLSKAAGFWFVAFALMQFPVGWALDTIGPKRTSSVLLGICGAGGAALFGFAQGPMAIYGAMILIGIGCAPVLMAGYYIFARMFAPAAFATLAGATLGAGSFGNLASSLPLAWAAEAFGWRGTMFGLTGATLLVALALAVFLRDPPPVERTKAEGRGSFVDLIKISMLWPVFAMMIVNYAPAAGLRGVWAGPYFGDVFGMDAGGIGRATLIMGCAMIAGAFLYGPVDRILGRRKALIASGNGMVFLCLIVFISVPGLSSGAATALLAGIGFFGATYPLLISQARDHCPPHLLGRGVTLMNFFGIGGAGIMQFATGRIFDGQAGRVIEAQYGAVFLTFAIVLGAGLSIYLLARPRRV